MGRHLGVFSCTMLMYVYYYPSDSESSSSITSPCASVGRIIGTGIFSTPSSILSSVNSVGASLMLWVLGFVLSFCGLFVWLEFGTMIPRSGGEKVYLEAVYTKPKFLATVIFAMNAILLGFTAAGCIVSSYQPHSSSKKFNKIYLDFVNRSLPASKNFANNIYFPHCSHFPSILVAAGQTADPWVERGIAIGGMFSDFKSNQLLPLLTFL